MQLPDLLTIIKIATKATEGLRNIRPRQESRDSRVQDAVSLILRTLYFAPDGILSLLKEVAEGKRPTDARLRQALIDFNDQQWKIEGVPRQATLRKPISWGRSKRPRSVRSCT